MADEIIEQAGAEQETAGAENMTFDQMLKANPAYQAEFDRRMTKGLTTAREKWAAEQAADQTEAKKLAKMTDEQRDRYNLKKEREAFNAEKAAFDRQRLTVETGKQLQQNGYDAAFADFLTGADAEATSANLEKFSGLMDAFRQSVTNSTMRGNPPKSPTDKKRGYTREDIKGMTSAEINAHWAEISEQLKRKD